MIGVGSDYPTRSLDAGLVFAAEIEAQHNLIDADPRTRVARVEPDPALQRDEALLGTAGEDQGGAEDAVSAGQVRADRQGVLGLGARPLVIAARQQHTPEARAGLAIGAV